MNQSPMDSFPVLGADGPFATKINDFKARPVQQLLASQIERSFKANKSLVAEAGTGIGKTFAYLVPAIRTGNKCLISTATKNLQEQLFQRDIPKVCEILDVKPRVALLKGRSNYLCLHRMRETGQMGRFSSKQSSHDYQTIVRWSSATKDGDMSELLYLAEDSDVRPAVTSTNDNCLSMDCPDYDDCYVLKARTRAMQADILVINHHLLCADLALKEDGFGELLPEVEHIIVDEAHRLADVVSMFFGVSFSSRQITELAGDMQREYQTESKELGLLPELAQALLESVSRCREAIDGLDNRGSWQELARRPQFLERIRELSQCVISSRESLAPHAEHSRGLESCQQRLERLSDQLKLMLDDVEQEQVKWYEIFKQSFVVHQTPINIDKIFRTQWQAQGGSWIFTSATLAIDNNLNHYQQQMGLQDAAQVSLPSPFDYKSQAVMYLPQGLPEPSEHGHTKALMKAALPVLRANKGRAFALFTSYRALHEAAEWLSVHSQFNLLIQGTADKTALLERFVKEQNSVLLATASFWEGVDVKGAKLSCVIIDKLPFSVPSDPVLKARIDLIKSMGRRPFDEIQLPRAVLALKQGAGRLIRDHDDRGVLVLGDTRLVTKSYGRKFIVSLPDMARTRELNKVLDFIGE
jgi:ATP-dependent DNA helicase DinG